MAIQRIEKDRGRFRAIINGHIKKNFQRVMGSELIGRQGGKAVSVPVPWLEIPHFCHGKNLGGVGMGPGEPGDTIGYDPLSAGPSAGGAGADPGEHILEVELTLQELAALMAEEMELPALEPKGQKSIIEEFNRYTGIRHAGPESLRHFKRSYKKALKRQIASGEYDPEKPLVVIAREDKLYRSPKVVAKPRVAAVIFYVMDISGSMLEEQKEIVRQTSFWIDVWISSHYQNIDRRYIVHDAVAKEVPADEFYRTRESGGTIISSAYKLCNWVVDKEYPPVDWNIYLVQFSDGGNLGEDGGECSKVLRHQLVPKVNRLFYGQVKSAYGSGNFINFLRIQLAGDVKLVCAEIDGKDEIYDCIKTFFGKRR